ncbi:MAG: PopZ family protein [Oricola sp.]
MNRQCDANGRHDMAQSSALRDQPSMDEILASIRRIIDTGESQAKATGPKPEDVVPPETDATIPPPAANDAGRDRARLPQNILPNSPRTQRGKAGDAPGDIAAAVDAYLEQERSGRNKPASTPEPETASVADVPALAVETLPEPDISEVEAALRAEFNPVDRDLLAVERQAKYDARFTEEDDGAFRQVGSLLRGKVGDIVGQPQPEPNPAPEKDRGALVSDAVSRSVSNSFASLSDMLLEKHGRDLDVMAEEMLRPMLQDWLDNNLPSLVERLVRSEIERIARGEPRGA